MTDARWLANLAAYSLQVAMLVAAAAALVGALRVSAPRVRLIIWQALLVACLVLPLAQPWRPAPSPRVDATDAILITLPAVAVEPAAARGFPVTSGLAAVLLGGALLRLGWLGLGLLRLARYRRDATALDPMPPAFEDAASCAGARATMAVAAGLSGPVTFGLQRPVVLLPPAVLTLDPALQRSVVCHELLHVRRGDWIWSVAEEVVCAIAWFHPAIWWLVAQIDLAREQHVDAEVVRLTGGRKPYLEALLYLASPERGADLAPAPALLRRRHLAKRLLVLAKEVSMSRPRIVVSVAAVGALLALTAGAAAVSFPLVGRPSDEATPADQSVQEPLRVGGNIKPPQKIHDVRPVYPPEALEARVQGVVILEVTIGTDGSVADAKVLRSIPELDQAALDAVRQWVFTPTLLNGVAVPVIMTVTVNFTLDSAQERGGPGQVRSPGARPFKFVQPVYPADAVAAKVEGTVILDAVIGVSGKVVSVKLVDGPGVLAKSAIDAVRQWEFLKVTSPHTARIEIEYSLKDGKPITSWAMKISPR